MIRVVFYRRSGKVVGFEASGHADFAEAGRDIVCAAVSAILQTACEGMTVCAEGACSPDALARIRRSDGRGYLRLRLRARPDSDCLRDAQLILQVAHAGVRAIEAQYPDCVRVEWTRV